MFRKLAVICILTFPMVSVAQEATEAGEPDPWSGKATLGYLATSGNTENTSINTGFEIGYTRNKWFHQLTAKAVNSSQQEETTAEAYQAGWKTEYSFSESAFAFGRADWRKDRFSGYARQLSATVGAGYRFIDTENHTLNAELGAGARQQDTQDGIEENDTVIRGGLNYVWRLSETAQFNQDLAIETGETNTYIESVSAIKATLIGDLALVASYTIKNNSDVPVGLENTDTFTALSLEYGW